MELFTVGKEIYCSYKLHMSYKDMEFFTDDIVVSDRFSITLIESGSGILQINDQEIAFTASSILCLNETEVSKLKTSSGFSARSIYFEPSVVNGRFNFDNIRDKHNGFSPTEEQDVYLLYPFIQRNQREYCMISIDSETIKAVNKLFTRIESSLTSQKDEFWPCRSRSLLLEALILITKSIECEENNFNDLAEKSKGDIPDIVTYIQTNYQNKITLNALAKMFHTNRTTLNEQFLKETDLPIIDYLIKYRVMLAATMLRDTLLTIEEIMERVGFNSPTHFWRMFKKYTSLSPSQYRNEYCWLK